MRRILCTLALLATLSVAPLAQAQERSPAGLLDLPRYKESPINLLVEAYVLDVIGHLPAERASSLQAMNLQRTFGTKAVEWRAVLRETLHFSDTIDIAILDLWYRNSEIASAQGGEYLPMAFAMDFTDRYFEDGSRVDVWTPSSLALAKRRIAQRRNSSD